MRERRHALVVVRVVGDLRGMIVTGDSDGEHLCQRGLIEARLERRCAMQIGGFGIKRRRETIGRISGLNCSRNPCAQTLRRRR